MNADVAEPRSWLLFAGLNWGSRSDSWLVEGARSGDPSALDEIVRRHQGRVYNLAYRMLRQREDAEDVTQDAFLKAFDALARLRDDAAFGPWVSRIAANICLRRLRSRSRASELPTDMSALAESASSPEDPLRLEIIRNTRSAIAGLPPKYRLAAVAFHLEGRSYKEAARMAGVSVRTLQTWLHRARRMLREMLGDAIIGGGKPAR